MKNFKYQVALLFVYLFSLSCTAQQINWSETKLTWGNFKKRAGKTEFYKAFTNSGISFMLDQKNDSVTIEVAAYFNPEESWVQRDTQNDILLAHEQLHFDITELYARKMRAQMAQYVGMNPEKFAKKKLSEKVKKIYKNLYNEMQNEQRRYDVETAHGIDGSKQDMWQRSISDELIQLIDFTR